MAEGILFLSTLATTAASAAGGAAVASAPLNLLAFTTTAGGTFGILGLSAGGLGTALLNVGLSAGATYALTFLRERKNDPSPQRAQQTVRASIGPRRKGYGRLITGGQVFFFQAAQGNLQTGIALCDGPIDAFEQHLLNDNVAVLSGVTVTNLYKHNGDERVRLYTGLGPNDQAAIDSLLSYYPGQWTSDHRGRGVAIVVTDYGGVPENDFRSVYPNGQPPGYRAQIRAAKVFDARAQPTQSPTSPATWTWRENAGACISDFAMSAEFGFGIPADRIAHDFNEGGFAAFNDLCDEAIAKKAGGVEARYRVTGIVTADEEPSSVMARMLACCDGELYLRPDAKLGIRGGKWTEPDFTITDRMLTALTIEPGPDAVQAYSGLKITVASENHVYQEVEAQPWIDAELEEAIGSEVLETLRLTMCPSISQGRRLAKIAIAKANPLWRGTGSVTMEALKIIAKRNAYLTIEELGFTVPVLLRNVHLDSKLTGLTFDWQTLYATPYAWNPAAEEGEAPPNARIVPPDQVPPAPTNVLITFPRPTGFDDGVALRYDWEIAGTQWVNAHSEVYRKETGQPEIINGVTAPARTYTSNAVNPVSHEVKVRAVTPGGVKGPYSAPQTVTPGYDSVPPTAPSDITATDLGGGVTRIAVALPGSSNIFLCRIVIAAASYDTTIPAAPSSTVQVDISGLPGSYTVQAYALNRSRISSGVYSESF